MAQSIISKEELLENAYEIAEEGGVSALSIRGLATKSGVSVGTVYRFFAAKDELTIATIELYFAAPRLCLPPRGLQHACASRSRSST